MDAGGGMPEARKFAPVPACASDLLAAAALRYGPNPALDFLGRQTSYAELARMVRRTAAGLQRIGVAKGVHVGLCLPNCPYYVIFYHAVLLAGGTVANFNPLYTEHEIEQQARESDTRIMVSLDARMIHDKIANLAPKNLFTAIVVCRLAAALPLAAGLGLRLFKRKDISRIPNAAPFIPFERLIKEDAAPAPVACDPARDIAVLQFTGGTTGIPKAAMLTHANVTANVAQSVAVFEGMVPGQERFLALLPLCHVFAMTSIMNLGLHIGAELLLLPRPDMKQVIRTLARRSPTVLHGVPTLFTALNLAAAAAKKPVSFAGIKFCISGGAPIPAEVKERFEALSGCAVLEGYGLSETSPVVSFNRLGRPRAGTVGQAMPDTVIEIRDPEHPGVLLPQGERGEVCVRGPQVMLGYYKRPEETAAVFYEGALRTGDIGILDADGYLTLVDRIKDLILCGGYNVYPRVIEEAAYQHPAVHEAVAIGIADAYRGQSPKLFVTLRPDHAVAPAEILAFLRDRLNKIEMPKEVEIRAELPKTMVGKLSKKELIAEAAARAAS